MKTSLATAFEDLFTGMIALDRGWICERERTGMRRAACEVRRYAYAAVSRLVQTFDRLDENGRTFAHEAYLAVLAFGQLLRRAKEAALCDPVALETCHESVTGMLDALSPFISRADDGLRRVLLEDEPIEDVAARSGRAG